MKICSKCNARGFTYGCPVCKRNARYEAQGAQLSSCRNCGIVTKLSSEELCKPCLKTLGMKECSQCRQVLMQDLAFHAKRGRCKTCEAGENPEILERPPVNAQVFIGWLQEFRRFAEKPSATAARRLIRTIDSELRRLQAS